MSMSGESPAIIPNKANVSTRRGNDRRLDERRVWVGSVTPVNSPLIQQRAERFGPIAGVYAPPQRNYMFINYEHAQDARKAIADLQGMRFPDGSVCTARVANQAPQRDSGQQHMPPHHARQQLPPPPRQPHHREELPPPPRREPVRSRSRSPFRDGERREVSKERRRSRDQGRDHSSERRRSRSPEYARRTDDYTGGGDDDNNDDGDSPCDDCDFVIKLYCDGLERWTREIRDVTDGSQQPVRRMHSSLEATLRRLRHAGDAVMGRCGHNRK